MIESTVRWFTGTAADFTAANRILYANEIGFESDTGFMKKGDGTTKWPDLSYLPTPAGILATSITDSDATHAPNGNAVFDALALKEAVANKATNFSTINDTKYPSTAAVRTYAGGGAPIPAADSTARLALTGLAKYAEVLQVDTNVVYRLEVVGGEAVAANWSIPFQSAVLQADFPKVNDTLANVTDLTLNLTAGRWYRVTGRFRATVTTTDDQGGGKWDFGGGTAGATGIDGNFTARLDTVTSFNGLTALDSPITNDTGGAFIVSFDFTIQVGTGGTLIPRFAQNSTSAPDTATLLKYSTLTAQDVTPA